ncbi:MAG: SDR family NAD(P)-dependent oxidoreductase [Candidatus Fimivivens sp.]|nr:SDR family NAD(P)-dependent oxidoreductase [Candidatus Fimivivens sp.]
MLNGKNAIITGSRRGIGHATVETFAKNGANVWACARKFDETFESDMNLLSEKYGVTVTPVYFDISSDGEMKKAVKQIQADKRSIDILVNNAATVATSTSFAMTSMAKMEEIFAVNFFAQIRLTQYISRLMMRQKSGSIVNLVSIAALDGDPAQLEYVGSKAAMVGATKKLAIELGAYNIRVNAVAPGIIDTDMGYEMQRELMQATLQKTIMKRLGKTEEIADAISFLASDSASFITGQILRVDGGM